jgi:protein-tyrosine kinase
MEHPLRADISPNEARTQLDRESTSNWRNGMPAVNAVAEEFAETRLLNDPRDRLLGDLLCEARGLTPEQVDEILALQRETGVRFGVAAIRLGHSTERDVLYALARQYHYPFALEGSENYNPELVVGTDPFGEQAEVFRELRSQLIQGVMEPGSDGRRPALAVISPNVGDGKSFFAANLAIAFSQLGGRTLLVDADLRSPRQHDIFGVDPKTGISSVLSGRTKERVIHRISAIPSLFVMPVGAIPPNPLELVQGMPFSLLIREMTQKFDHVIVDTPAASHGSDCRVVAMKCGAALAIGRQGKTKMPELESLVSKMSKRSTKFAGIVVNQW